MVIAILLLSFNIFYPETAKASLFSFIKHVATSDQASAKVDDSKLGENSQNISVLKAPVNSNPNVKVSLDEPVLASANALIAEIGPAGTASDVDQEENANTEISTYVVRSGDTLAKVAKMFEVSVNTVVWANNLDRSKALQEGQTLIILPISGIRHTVKSGETINSIVAKYKADLEEVISYNDLSLNTKLTVGSVIIIPNGEPLSLPAPKPKSSKSIPSNPVHNANGPYYPGYYIRPISGGVKTQGLHGYNAVDLAAPVGTPIFASAEGTVIASLSGGGWNGGYGNYVIISHTNGSQTLYAHTSKNLVAVGQHVDQGQIIAKVGATGRATGPHVHFEIRGAKNPF